MKIVKIIVNLIVAAMFMLSCSKNNLPVATYRVNDELHSITLGTLRDELLMGVLNQQIDPKDVNNLTKILENYFLMPELIMWDMIEAGVTNQPNFQKEFRKQTEASYLYELSQIGYELYTNMIEHGKFELAKASHILFRVNKFTNINGKQIELSEAEIQKAWEEKRILAQNTLNTLKEIKKDFDKEFSNIALDNSDDYGSAIKGGDLSYFPRGVMVPPFEDAVFNASKKGLVPELIKSEFGYHIIYITETPKVYSKKQLENKVGEQAKNIWYTVNQSTIRQNIENYFRNYVDSENKKTNYLVELFYNNVTNRMNVSDIPGDQVLVKIWGKPYTWDYCKSVIQKFVPNFEDDLNIYSFMQQMGNLRNFMFYVELAIQKGAQETKDFQDSIKKNEFYVLKTMANGEYYKQLNERIRQEITITNLKEYYNQMKAVLTKPKLNKKGQPIKDKDGQIVTIQKTFTEASNEIFQELYQVNMQGQQQLWQEQAKKKYQVEISDNGINSLSAILSRDLEKYIKKQEAKQAEAKKKQQAQMKESQKQQQLQQQQSTQQ